MRTIIDPGEVAHLLDVASEQQSRQRLSAVQHASVREDLLACGLRHLAQDCGITLREPLAIDANGEFHIIVDGATYGAEFCEVLNQVPVRCGISAVKGHMIPENSWCRLNHFEAERLILIEAERARLQEELTKREQPDYEKDIHAVDTL